MAASVGCTFTFEIDNTCQQPWVTQTNTTTHTVTTGPNHTIGQVMAVINQSYVVTWPSLTSKGSQRFQHNEHRRC